MLKACQVLLDWEEGEVELKNQRQLSVRKIPKNYTIRTIPLKTRMKVLQRDNFKCFYCGLSPATDPEVQLEIDHIHPFSKGGILDIENLQVVCSEYNKGKGNQKIKQPNST